MTTKLYVLLFDVVQSSLVKDREALTQTIEKAIQKCNAQYSRELFAPLEITRGDEIAGVLESALPVYRIVASFVEEMQPYAIRGAIAFGEITAGVETRRSSVMDGPAFYAADRIMNQAKKSQRIVGLTTGTEALDLAAEALMNLLLCRWQDLTPLQRDVVRMYLSGKKQTEIAQALGRTQQQVSRTLKAVRGELVRLSEQAIEQILEEIDRRNRRSEAA